MSDEIVSRRRFENGPYVQVACFCETAVEAKDGTFSVIRIIDTLTHTQVGPEPPDRMPSVTYQLRLLLMLKSGDALGRRTVEVRQISPSGEAKEPWSFPAHFEGDEKGVAIQAQIQLEFEEEGLYRFDVCIDGDKLTAIPFRVKYNPIRRVSPH